MVDCLVCTLRAHDSTTDKDLIHTLPPGSLILSALSPAQEGVWQRADDGTWVNTVTRQVADTRHLDAAGDSRILVLYVPSRVPESLPEDFLEEPAQVRLAWMLAFLSGATNITRQSWQREADARALAGAASQWWSELRGAGADILAGEPGWDPPYAPHLAALATEHMDACAMVAVCGALISEIGGADYTLGEQAPALADLFALAYDYAEALTYETHHQHHG